MALTAEQIEALIKAMKLFAKAAAADSINPNLGDNDDLEVFHAELRVRELLYAAFNN